MKGRGCLGLLLLFAIVVASHSAHAQARSQDQQMPSAMQGFAGPAGKGGHNRGGQCTFNKCFERCLYLRGGGGTYDNTKPCSRRCSNLGCV